MTFRNMDALKNYILSCNMVAVEKARDKVVYIINHFLTEYYKEFEPEFYVRTSQLLCSLIKTDVKIINNKCIAEVYFDIDALDYSKRVVPASFSSFASSNNTYKRENWTKENDAWVLETAMTGGNTGLPHGGYKSGTKIWDESLNVLNKEAIGILKEKLIEAGVPIK